MTCDGINCRTLDSNEASSLMTSGLVVHEGMLFTRDATVSEHELTQVTRIVERRNNIVSSHVTLKLLMKLHPDTTAVTCFLGLLIEHKLTNWLTLNDADMSSKNLHHHLFKLAYQEIEQGYSFRIDNRWSRNL